MKIQDKTKRGVCVWKQKYKISIRDIYKISTGTFIRYSILQQNKKNMYNVCVWFD